MTGVVPTTVTHRYFKLSQRGMTSQGQVRKSYLIPRCSKILQEYQRQVKSTGHDELVSVHGIRRVNVGI